MTVVVISQPMFLPWIGLFEQARLSDVFVHYDDVQRPQGRSFFSRVQLIGAQGTSWLTAPIDRKRSGSSILETFLVADPAWRKEHLETIRHLYRRQPNFEAMFSVVREIYGYPTDSLAEFNINAFELITARLGFSPRFERSSALGINGASTERLVRLASCYHAKQYLTGHGALNYLDHESFEQVGTEVRYMRYATASWPQHSPVFSPYVTILDLLASVTFEKAHEHFLSETKSWRIFGESDRAVAIRGLSDR